MSAGAPKIFVSANPIEFRTMRSQVVKLLGNAGAEVSMPDNVGEISLPTLHQTAQQIFSSDTVILLIGKKSGPVPSVEVLASTFQTWEAAAPGFILRLGFGPQDRPSLAQLEARLAYALGKRVFPILCAEDYPGEGQGSELASAAQQQAAHRTMLAGLMQGTPPSSAKALLKLVESLPIAGLTPPRPRIALPQSFALPRKWIYAAAAAVLVPALGMMALFSWLSRWKTATSATAGADALDTRTARSLMMEAVMESQAPDFVGYETSARQRMDDALHHVEWNHGLAPGTLRHIIDDPHGAFSVGAPMDEETSYLGDVLHESGLGVREHAVALAQDPLAKPLSSDAKALEPFMIGIASCNSRNMLLPAAELAEKCRDAVMGFRDTMDRVRYELVVYPTLARQGLSPFMPEFWETIQRDLSNLPAKQAESFAAVKLRVRTWQARQWINEGKYGNAQAELKSVAEEVSKKWGPDSMEHVVVLDELAHALIEDACYKEAQQVLNDCGQIHRRTSTTEHAAYATTCLRCSELALAQSSLKPAENGANMALELRRKTLGADNGANTDHYAVVECLSQLGLVLQKQGKLDQAEKLLTAALQSQEILRGKKSQPTSIARRQDAMILHELGALKDSFAALKECQNAQFSVFHDTPEYAMTLDCLGVVGYNSGFQRDPYKTFTEAQGILEKTVGSQHPLVAAVLTHAAAAHLDFDTSYPAAESMLNQALSIEEQHGMGSTLQAAETVFELGRCLERLDRFQEAEQKEQRAFDISWANTGDSVQTAIVLHRLARCQIDLGKESEALSNHHRADVILGDKLVDSHYLHCKARLLEALTYRTAGNFPEAIRSATEAYDGFQKIMERGSFWSNESANLINQCSMQYLSSRFPPQPGESPAAYIQRLRRLRDNGGQDPSPDQPQQKPAARAKLAI